ncbi:hypothetical protein PG985_014605 [Apiospora marii]|uniref:uncharacterized protein n=1 Tax=Apiospora marii TaxID=335849 RepID=UPI00313107EF
MAQYNQTGHGFLVPAWFEEQEVVPSTMNTASVFLGLSLGSAVFAAAKASQQTSRMWKRHKTITAYAIIQIIINRLSLLLMLTKYQFRLKWGVAALMTAINVSVFIVWIPARLQISDSFVNFNRIWDPLEKIMFLIIDLGLNITFIRLVKNRLIANGLTKYDKLLSGNLALVAINISLDVIFIGLMWLPNTSVYLNFQSFAYLCKLYIEMTMADLIRKVVRSTDGHSSGHGASSKEYAKGTGSGAANRHKSKSFMGGVRTGLRGRLRRRLESRCGDHNGGEPAVPHIRGESLGNANTNARDFAGLQGIQKTVVTEVVHTKLEDEEAASRRSSQGSSQQELGPCVSVESDSLK